MIALRFLPRENWEPRLRYYRCRPLDGKTKLNTAEWWISEWGFVFTVPVEPNGSCHQEALQRLIADIVGSAPIDTRFPPPGFEDKPEE